MLYIKFKIKDAVKHADFQKLYNHMVQIREPGFKHEEDDGPEIEWDGMTQVEVDAAVEKLSTFLDINPEEHRYRKMVPSYANKFLESYLQHEKEESGSLGEVEAVSIFNYLEYGFEVDLDNLEKINEHLGIVEFSTGNYPFGGMERFIMTLKAFNLIPIECYDGFSIYEFDWISNFEYNNINLPEKTKKLIMEKNNENTDNPKQRHGCVTAWLILMIVLNSITALSYLLVGDSVSESFPDGISTSMLIVLAILGIANVIFAVLLFQWNKMGFWGFLATSIVALGINLSIGVGIGQSLLGLLGIVILYAVLQIKKDAIPAWEHLE